MIHTVTLNPAIDKLLYLKHFQKDVTNRLQSSDITIGGKGTHVSINLKILGLDNTAFGIVHGATGKRIIDLLTELDIDTKFLTGKNNHCNSRTNYLIIEDSGHCSTLASRGVLLSQDEIEMLIETMFANIQDNDYLVLSGDATNCPDTTVYNKIIKRMKSKNLKVFLDTSGETLKQCILESPYLIKPNLDELTGLCGFKPDTDEKIIDAIDSLAGYKIPIIAVSLGGDGSIVKTPEGFYRVYPPKITVKNTIGCGDCFLSGIIYGLNKHFSITETLRIATAVSAATAESSSSVGFDLTRSKELETQVQIFKIK